LYQGTTLAVPQLLEMFPCFLAAASISPSGLLLVVLSETLPGCSAWVRVETGCCHIWSARHYGPQVDVAFNGTLAPCERCNKHPLACFPEWDALITPLRHPLPGRQPKLYVALEISNIVDINKNHSVLFKNSLSSCFSLSGYRHKSDRVHPAVQLASVRLTVWNPFMHSSQVLRERSQSLQDSAFACALDSLSIDRELSW
jgi:hypothetical protein